MLGFLEKLTLKPDAVRHADVLPILATGVSEQAVEDAIYICMLFNVIDRVADALNFAVPSPESFAQGAHGSLHRGYDPFVSP